jgi:hypothetical protein
MAFLFLAERLNKRLNKRLRLGYQNLDRRAGIPVRNLIPIPTKRFGQE